MTYVMMVVMMVRTAEHRTVVRAHAHAPAAKPAEGAIDSGPAIVPEKRS